MIRVNISAEESKSLKKYIKMDSSYLIKMPSGIRISHQLRFLSKGTWVEYVVHEGEQHKQQKSLGDKLVRDIEHAPCMGYRDHGSLL